MFLLIDQAWWQSGDCGIKENALLSEYGSLKAPKSFHYGRRESAVYHLPCALKKISSHCLPMMFILTKTMEGHLSDMAKLQYSHHFKWCIWEQNPWFIDGCNRLKFPKPLLWVLIKIFWKEIQGTHGLKFRRLFTAATSSHWVPQHSFIGCVFLYRTHPMLS